MSANPMTFGSLFSGIGTFDLGLERAGWQCKWQVEIDPVAQSVLRRHWPDVHRERDVIECGAHNLAPVDLIVFGSPCQDTSVAGQRAGLAGKRSGLFFEAIRIIDELRPRFALWEQPPGVFSTHGGRDFAAVVDAFLDIGASDICWRVLDAQFFGVPQRRRRIFLIAGFGPAGGGAEAILFEREGVRRDTEARGAPGQGASAISPDRAGSEGEVAGTLGGGGNRGHCDDLDRTTFIPEVAATLSSGVASGHGARVDNR